jgi:hypothetical protein
MPDITMCNSADCKLRETCYRNSASGTKPSEYRQAYWVKPPLKEDGNCDHYWNRS